MSPGKFATAVVAREVTAVWLSASRRRTAWSRGWPSVALARIRRRLREWISCFSTVMLVSAARAGTPRPPRRRLKASTAHWRL